MLQILSHVKWFVDSEEILENAGPAWPWSTNQIIVASILSIATICIGAYIHRFFPSPPKGFIQKATKWEPTINKLFAALAGLFMVVVGIFWGVILTPEAAADSSNFAQILRVIEIVTGILLLSWNARGIFVGAVLAVPLFLATGLVAGPVFYLENIFLVGAVIYLVTKFSNSGFITNALKDYALPILRVTVGITLIAFAFSEKLVHPILTQAFLQEHGSWNFFPAIGIPQVTDEYFTLAAGFTESVFGVLLILGIAVRITTLALGSLFATTVVTMLVTKGQWEVEDLPVYAAAILFVAYGAGNKLRISRDRINSNQKTASRR